MVEIHVNTYAVVGILGFFCLLLFFFFRRGSSEEEDLSKSKNSTRFKNKKAKKPAQKRNARNQEALEVTSDSRNNVANNKKGNRKENRTEDLSGYTPSEEDEVKTILEFIKGKDSEELMRREKISTTKPKVKKSDPKEEVVIEDFIADEGSGEEFLLIKRKRITVKKKEEEKETPAKFQKPFFKTSVRQLKEGEKPDRKRGEGSEDQRDQRERKRVQRKSSQEENRDGNWRNPSREHSEQDAEANNEKKHRPPPSPPTLEDYNPPPLEDIMASMTHYYQNTKPERKPKPQQQQQKPKAKLELKPPKEKKGAQKLSRVQRKGFDSLKKKIQISILQFLDPADLAAFSFGCKSFAKVARAEPLWKILCLRDFGLSEKTQDKWKLTYKAQFLQQKN